MIVHALALRSDPSHTDEALVYVALSAPHPTDAPRRPPAHLALALDVSSSMGGQPLAAAIEAVRGLANNLGPDDRMALVCFDAHAQVTCPPRAMDETALADLLAALEGCTPGMGTNLGDGLALAGDLLTRAHVPGAHPRLLVLTDGHPSVGPTGIPAFEAVADDLRGKGVSISTIGFGVRYAADLLEAIARAGDGNYHFVAYDADLAAVLSTELSCAQEVSATSVEVRLVVDKGVRAVELLHRYPTQTDADGLTATVGTVGRLASRKLLFRVQSASETLGRLDVTWTPVEGPRRTEHVALALDPAPDRHRAHEVRREEGLLRLATAERRVWEHLLQGQTGAASHLLHAAREIVDRLGRQAVLGAMETSGHLRRLDQADEVIAGRLDRAMAYRLSQQFTARISTSMIAAHPREGDDG